MPKFRQAPGLWHLPGPVWYSGGGGGGEMTPRPSPAALCQAACGVQERNPVSRVSAHTVFRVCQGLTLTLPSTL